jgi:hypothetical protein
MSQGCLGTPCVIDPARIRRVTQATCASSPPPDFSTWNCMGAWATLPSGGLCTIQVVPVDAIVFTVTCGACVTIVAY